MYIIHIIFAISCCVGVPTFKVELHLYLPQFVQTDLMAVVRIKRTHIHFFLQQEASSLIKF